jgi:hypothetical protein
LRIYIIPNVRGLKSFFALLLLGTWFSCTAHCTLEMMTADKPLACCDNTKFGSNSSQAPASPDHCVCGWVKSGGYTFSESTPLVIAPTDALPLFTLSSPGEESFTDPALPKLIFSRPKFSTSWQFAFRTALPARAPSLAS